MAGGDSAMISTKAASFSRPRSLTRPAGSATALPLTPLSPAPVMLCQTKVLRALLTARDHQPTAEPDDFTEQPRS
jgi:hypothetical protein